MKMPTSLQIPFNYGALLAALLGCQSAHADDPILWVNFDDGMFTDSSVARTSTVLPSFVVTSTDVPPGFEGGKSLDLQILSQTRIMIVKLSEGAEGFTLSHWLKPSGLLAGQGSRALIHGTISGFRTSIEQPDDGSSDHVQLAFGINDENINTKAKIPVNQWSHLAWRVKPDITELFVDGELAFTGQGLGSAPPVSDLLELAPTVNGFLPFSGLIDEIRFHDTLLESGEIQALLQKDHPKPSVIRVVVEGNSQIKVVLKDGTDATVVDSQLELKVNGEPVQPVITRDGSLVTMRYRLSPIPGQRTHVVSLRGSDSVGGSISWDGTAAPALQGRIIDPTDPPPIEFPPKVDFPGSAAEGAWNIQLIGVPGRFPFELDEAVDIALNPRAWPVQEFESEVLNYTTPYPQFANVEQGFFIFERELFPDFEDPFPGDHVLVAHSVVEHKGGALTLVVNAIGTFSIRLRNAEDGTPVAFTGATEDIDWDAAEPDFAGRYRIAFEPAGLFIDDLAPGNYEIEFFATTTGPLLGLMGEIYHELAVASGVVTMAEAQQQAQLIGDPTGPLPHATADSTPQMLELTSISRDSQTGHVTLTWPSQADTFYVVQRSTDLIEFDELSDGEVGVGGPATFTDRNPPAGSAYYRISERR